MAESPPAWLAGLLREAGGALPSRPWALFTWRKPPSVGTVVTIDSMFRGEPGDHGPALHALVIGEGGLSDRSALPTTVDVMVLSGPTEVAVATDRLLRSSECDLPYDLVARADLVGPVFLWQVGPALGHVDQGVVRALRGEADDEMLLEGAPLHGPEDARRRVRLRQLAEFQSISAEARRDRSRGRQAMEIVARDALGGDDPIAFDVFRRSGVMVAPGEIPRLSPLIEAAGLTNDATGAILAAQERALAPMSLRREQQVSESWPSEVGVGEGWDPHFGSWMVAVAEAGHRSCTLLSLGAERGPRRVMAAEGIPFQVMVEDLHVVG